MRLCYHRAGSWLVQGDTGVESGSAGWRSADFIEVMGSLLNRGSNKQWTCDSCIVNRRTTLLALLGERIWN